MIEMQRPDSSTQVNDVWLETQHPPVHQKHCSFQLMTNILVQKLCSPLKMSCLLITELLPLTAWQE